MFEDRTAPTDADHLPSAPEETAPEESTAPEANSAPG